jgi:hypothetical protein
MAINFNNDPSAGTIDISEENSPNNNNQAPTAINQTLNVFKNSEISITLNGTDPEGTKLKFFLVGGSNDSPKLGKIFLPLSPNEINLSTNNFQLLRTTIIYRPNQDQIGADTIKFFVEDSPLDGSAPRVSLNASVTINIVEAENAPTENNQQIDEIETEEVAFNLKPEAVLVADFKELFFAGENQQEQRTSSGFFLSESISRISLINSEIENYISDPIESQKQQINIFKNNINLKLAQEIDYLKILNNSVFSALESTNFISVSNDGITTFEGSESALFNQIFNTIDDDFFKNFRSSILPYDFKSLLIDFGYNGNFIENEIFVSLDGTLTKTALFILENFKNIFKNHPRSLISNSLTISENDFFSLKNFYDNGGFSSDELVKINSLNSINLENSSEGGNARKINQVNTQPFFDRINNFLNQKFSNRQEKIVNLLIYVFNEINNSKTVDNNAIINSIKNYFPISFQTQNPEFFSRNFIDFIFGLNNNSLDSIDNSNLNINTLQKLVVNSQISTTNQQGQGQLESSFDNILSLEPHDIFINNLISKNNGTIFSKTYTKTAKTEYILKSIRLVNSNFSTNSITERIAQLENIRNSFISLFTNNNTLDPFSKKVFDLNFLNPKDLKDFKISSTIQNNSLSNANNLIKTFKNLIESETIFLGNTSFNRILANDKTLFLFSAAKKSKKLLNSLFLFCFYSAVIDSISLPQNHIFFNFRAQAVIEITNELKLMFTTPNNTALNSLREQEIGLPAISGIMSDRNTMLGKIIIILSELYKSTHIGSKAVKSSADIGSVFIASESNSVMLFSCMFYGLSEFFDFIFNISPLRRRVINNTDFIVFEKKSVFSSTNINSMLSISERDLRLKFKSITFIDNLTENIINSYENLKNILSTSNVQTGFKDGISSINDLFENNQQGLSNAVQNLILNDNNIDKSVKNFEYIKNKISTFESGFIFDSIYELSKLGSSRFLEIFEKSFRNSEFLDTDEFFNRKIISIGLPAGFLNNVKTQKSNNSSQTTSKNANIIKIRVFKTDLRFPEIILKPKEFYFECSRYIDESRLAEVDITQFLEKMPMINFIRGSIMLKTDRSVEDTFDPAVHAFLTPAQKNDIIKNHCLDYFTKVYLRLLNNSTRHFIDDNLSLLNISNGFNKNDINAFTNLTNPVIQHVAQNLNLPQTDLDNIRFNVFNSFLDLNGEITKIRDYIYFPKKFDRIFNIIIDPNSFEVDYENTIEINFPNGEQDFEIFEQEIGIININNTKKIPSESPISSSRTVFDRYIFDIELL